MRYQMKLFSEPFDTIVQGRKTIEVRCYDEKRKIHSTDTENKQFVRRKNHEV